jgi:hypothetical protein
LEASADGTEKTKKKSIKNIERKYGKAGSAQKYDVLAVFDRYLPEQAR